MLYPLKFKPIYKDKIWGGQKLKTLLHKDFSPLPNCGESWELSGMPGNESVAANGFLKGNSLNEILEIYLGDLVGEGVFDQFGEEFPLLVKWIDAEEDLSVQVHPDDATARRRHQCNGKTELWHVVDAAAGAGLYVGFKPGTDKAAYLQALQDGTLEKLLQFHEVKKGDTFFIPAGTVHSIGKGVLLCEIQQSSDTTYRIFDWNRKTADGKSRELHTDQALDVLDFEQKQTFQLPVAEHFNSTTPLLRSPFFNLNLLAFDRPLEKVYAAIDSFVIYLCTEGKVTFVHEEGTEELVCGETLLIPASMTEVRLFPQKRSQLLEIYMDCERFPFQEEVENKNPKDE